VVTKDGHVRWLANRIECEADPATPGGLRLYGAVQDVTARKDSEAQFRQAQKMESIGRLASGVAHDFNNMLTVITCSSELALMELDRHDLVRVHLDEIGRAGKRAAALTRQLLTFSRKHLVQLEILDLTLVLADVEMMLRRLIGEHITVVVAPRGKPACVKADRGLIEQVIMNLAVNAQDAMPNGGTLTFTIELVRLDADHRSLQLPVQPGSYVMLAVSDTGMGMTEATIERIFEPFFTTKGKDKGTGLGLATVYGIVRQSGGGIRVESSPGRGTRFMIYLPRVVESAQDQQTHQFPAPARGSETILVVEDEAQLRDLVRQMLEAAGYHVLTCATGADALRLMQRDEHAADLLLTDVVMPGMNGRELADRLVSLRPDMKVLYMSGYTDDALVQRSVIEHTDGFIGKPFTLTTLTEKIRQTMGSTA
jgi:signal transduction histidine kinase/ActR/RegA family two-component response regulator